MTGKITTFYSYKGGVGRTFALANIGVILAQWGKNILLIDWDIEAPGLNDYFKGRYSPSRGVVDYIGAIQNGDDLDWQQYISDISLPDLDGRLSLMPAAAIDTDFAREVQNLNWEFLYSEYDLGNHLERLRAEWLQNFDFVLIDSRTGVTDFSGITTAQLPDNLAFLFTANQQSLNGCCDIVRRAMEARRNLSLDRPALVPLPLPARFESREEYDRAQVWRQTFASKLKPFFEVWAPLSTDSVRLVDLLTIPYVPRWTFGEELAALLEPITTTGTRTPATSATYALETVAALLARNFQDIDFLLSSRDEYVLSAKENTPQSRSPEPRKRKIFISASVRDLALSHGIKHLLGENGFNCYIDEHQTTWGETWANHVYKELGDSDALVVLVNKHPSAFQETEVDHFLRHSLRSQARKPIIPIYVPGVIEKRKNSRLLDYQSILLETGSLREQLAPLLERLDMTSA